MYITPRIEKAIRIAATAHSRQKRKGSDVPYVIHPFSVMCIAETETQDEDTLIACLFHDIIEDVPDEYPAEKMEAEFGSNVLDIVMGVTKDESIEDWRERCEAYQDNLENKAPVESVTVATADKIHNMMSIIADHENIGEEVWAKFNSGREQQVWWYTSNLELIKRRTPDSKLIPRYEELLDQFKHLT